MRRDIMIFSAVLICAPFTAGSAFAGAERTITISGSANCSVVSQTFTVPVKMIGDKFELVEFSPGVNCANATPMKKASFDIYYNACPAPKGEGDLYWQNKNDASVKTSGNIKDVGIGEGDYCITFTGGRDGKLVIKYMEE